MIDRQIGGVFNGQFHRGVCWSVGRDQERTISWVSSSAPSRVGYCWVLQQAIQKENWQGNLQEDWMEDLESNLVGLETWNWENQTGHL